MSAIPLEAARGLRGPPAIGPPVAVESCPVPVEVAGEGVACLDEDEARWARVRAGDRLRPDGSGGAACADPGRLVRVAATLVANGRADEGVQACRRGLGTRPDDVPLRLALGRALSAAGHLEEAQAALLDAVSRQSRAAARPAPSPPASVADVRKAAPTVSARALRDEPTELCTSSPQFSDSGEVEIEGEPTNQEWKPDLMPQTGPAHKTARRDVTRQVTADAIEVDEPAHASYGSDERYVPNE